VHYGSLFYIEWRSTWWLAAASCLLEIELEKPGLLVLVELACCQLVG